MNDSPVPLRTHSLRINFRLPQGDSAGSMHHGIDLNGSTGGPVSMNLHIVRID
ncbi:MAG: hypothetical protein JXA20_12250 [Spirochaetes bacterium]|nr:hypothetical protein [Spirochaetota bacterium]